MPETRLGACFGPAQHLPPAGRWCKNPDVCEVNWRSPPNLHSLSTYDSISGPPEGAFRLAAEIVAVPGACLRLQKMGGIERMRVPLPVAVRPMPGAVHRQRQRRAASAAPQAAAAPAAAPAQVRAAAIACAMHRNHSSSFQLNPTRSCLPYLQFRTAAELPRQCRRRSRPARVRRGWWWGKAGCVGGGRAGG